MQIHFVSFQMYLKISLVSTFISVPHLSWDKVYLHLNYIVVSDKNIVKNIEFPHVYSILFWLQENSNVINASSKTEAHLFYGVMCYLLASYWLTQLAFHEFIIPMHCLTGWHRILVLKFL